MSEDTNAATALQIGDAPGSRGMEPRKIHVQLGIAPKSLDEGWRLAQLMATSSLVPKAYLGKPADVLVAIELGMEVGFAPMQALQSIAVINGRPSLWGDGFLALLMASPHYQDHEEYYLVDDQRCEDLTAKDLAKDTTTAVCTFWRRGKPKPVTRTFSIAKAKKAGLWSKEGPWQTYPDRMLAMRARGFAGRDCFPDVLRGIRTAEEARDQHAGDETSLEAELELPSAPPRPALRTSQVAIDPSLPAPSQAASAPAVGSASAAAPVPQSVSGENPAPAPVSQYIGTIVDVVVKPGGALVKLSTGFQAAAKTEALIRGAQMAKEAGLRVELIADAPRDPKFAATLKEIRPVADGASA